MPVRSHETHGFVQPLAVVAFAMMRVRRFALPGRPQVLDGRFECLQQLIQGSIGWRRGPVQIQPAAGFAKMTRRALPVFLVEVTVQMTIGKIDVALDNITRVIEQSDYIALSVRVFLPVSVVINHSCIGAKAYFTGTRRRNSHFYVGGERGEGTFCFCWKQQKQNVP